MAARTTDELIDLGLVHLRRFAVENHDNPFLRARAGLTLSTEDRSTLASLLSGDVRVKEWAESGPSQISKLRVGCVPRDVQLVQDEASGLVRVGVDSLHAFLSATPFWWVVSMMWCIEVGRKWDAKLPDEVIGFRLSRGFQQQPGEAAGIFVDPRRAHKRWRDWPSEYARSNPGKTFAATTFDLKAFYYSVSAAPSRIVGLYAESLGTRAPTTGRARVLTGLLDVLHDRHAGDLRVLRPRPGLSYDGTPLPVGPPSSTILANMLMALALRPLVASSAVDGWASYADDVVLVSTAMPDLGQVSHAYLQHLGVVSQDTRQLATAPAGLADFEVGSEKSSTAFVRHSEHPARGTDGLEPTRDVPVLEFDSVGDPYADEAAGMEWQGRLTTVLRAAYRRERVPKDLRRRIDRVISDLRVEADAQVSGHEIRALVDELDDAHLLMLRPHWSELLVALVGSLGVDEAIQLSTSVAQALANLRFPDELGEAARDATVAGVGLAWAQSCAEALAVCLSDTGRDEVAERYAGVPILSGLDRFVVDWHTVARLGTVFRHQQLVRAKFVSVPLAEFSLWSGPLIGDRATSAFLEWADSPHKGPRELRLERSVRFVGLHEVCIAHHLWISPHADDWLDATFTLLSTQPLVSEEGLRTLRLRARVALGLDDPVDVDAEIPESDSQVAAQGRDPLFIRVGLPSIRVPGSQLEDLIEGPGPSSEVASELRRAVLLAAYSAADRNVDLLVFPEWSVPPQTLAALINLSARNGMYVVAGQTPAIRAGRYTNFLWTSIPLTDHLGRRAALVPPPRQKRHLAPAEVTLLSRAGLVAEPGDKVVTYRWRGIGMGSMNCFEFADIASRRAIRRTADVLTMSSWNRDWRYFLAIQEATTRDNYCLTVCVNTGSYPGTRVMRPTSSDRAVVASVHGASQPTLVTCDVDLRPVVVARAQGRSPRELGLAPPLDGVQIDDYKPLPPAWDVP